MGGLVIFLLLWLLFFWLTKTIIKLLEQIKERTEGPNRCAHLHLDHQTTDNPPSEKKVTFDLPAETTKQSSTDKRHIEYLEAKYKKTRSNLSETRKKLDSLNELVAEQSKAFRDLKRQHQALQPDTTKKDETIRTLESRNAALSTALQDAGKDLAAEKKSSKRLQDDLMAADFEVDKLRAENRDYKKAVSCIWQEKEDLCARVTALEESRAMELQHREQHPLSPLEEQATESERPEHRALPLPTLEEEDYDEVELSNSDSEDGKSQHCSLKWDLAAEGFEEDEDGVNMGSA